MFLENEWGDEIKDFPVCPIFFYAKKEQESNAIVFENNQLRRIYSYQRMNFWILWLSEVFKDTFLEHKDCFRLPSLERPSNIALWFAFARMGMRLLIDLKGDASFAKSLPGVSLTKMKEAYLKVSKAVFIESLEEPKLYGMTLTLSSGSLGKPKAWMHDFSAHQSAFLGFSKLFCLSSKDSVLLTLPTHHISGLSMLYRTFQSGATLIIDKKRDISKTLLNHKITHTSLVSAQLLKIIDEKPALQNLCSILAGGSGIAEDVFRAFEKQYPHVQIFLSYGMTESCAMVMSFRFQKGRLGSFWSHPSLVYHLEPKGRNEGELMLEGPMMSSGYLDENGVFFEAKKPYPTGDWVRFEKGSMVFLGRKDGAYKSGGIKLYPEELENIIKKMEGIKEAFVLPYPSHRFGFVNVLAYRLDEGLSWGQKETKRLQELLKLNIPAKRIFGIFELEPLDGIKGGIKRSRSELKQLMLHRRVEWISWVKKT